MVRPRHSLSISVEQFGPIAPSWFHTELRDEQAHDLGKWHGAGRQVHLAETDATTVGVGGIEPRWQVEMRIANRATTCRMPVVCQDFSIRTLANDSEVAGDLGFEPAPHRIGAFDRYLVGNVEGDAVAPGEYGQRDRTTARDKREDVATRRLIGRHLGRLRRDAGEPALQRLGDWGDRFSFRPTAQGCSGCRVRCRRGVPRRRGCPRTRRHPGDE